MLAESVLMDRFKKLKSFGIVGARRKRSGEKRNIFGKCLAKYKCFMIDLLTLNKEPRWDFSHMYGIQICLYAYDEHLHRFAAM